jgi:hypothetical protein
VLHCCGQYFSRLEFSRLWHVSRLDTRFSAGLENRSRRWHRRHPTDEAQHRPASHDVPGRSSRAAFQHFVRRLAALERRLGVHGNLRTPALAVDRDVSRRWEIVEEDRLRREVERELRIRREHPALWRQMDEGRVARNQATAVLNRRLRAEGLRPVEVKRSLQQRVRKLQQPDVRTRAGTARRTRST